MDCENENDTELLCVVENKYHLSWVKVELQSFLPLGLEIKIREMNVEAEIYCKPKLTSSQREKFEEDFDDWDFTDVAYHCYRTQD